MRIVHEFHYKDPQATGTGRAYGGPVFERPRWRGFHADVMAVDTEQPCAANGHTLVTGDALHLEGDGDALIAALRRLLSLLEAIKAHEMDTANRWDAAAVQCPVCTAWHQSTESDHADGKGNRCRGAGA